jgi:hypothetical protein
MEEENKKQETEEVIEGTDIPVGSNEILIRGNIDKFISSLRKEKETNPELVSLKNESLGISIELISAKFDVVQLSDIALQLLSKIPVEVKNLRYIA